MLKIFILILICIWCRVAVSTPPIVVDKTYSPVTCARLQILHIVTKINGCPSKYESTQYGFTDPRERKAYIIGETCYSPEDGRLIFTHLKIHQNYCPKTKFVYGLKVVKENFYKKHRNENQKIVKHFFEIADYLTMKNRFSELGVGDLDVLVGQYIDSGYLYHPHFQDVFSPIWNHFILLYTENCNLKVLQTDILNHEMYDEATFTIYTGSHGVLNLPVMTGGDYVDVYLEDGKYPVPQFIWVLVMGKYRTDVFIYLNNPNVSAEEISEIGEDLCVSKCNQIPWIKNLKENGKFMDISNGYVWCCGINDVKNVITEIPIF